MSVPSVGNEEGLWLLAEQRAKRRIQTRAWIRLGGFAVGLAIFSAGTLTGVMIKDLDVRHANKTQGFWRLSEFGEKQLA